MVFKEATLRMDLSMSPEWCFYHMPFSGCFMEGLLFHLL